MPASGFFSPRLRSAGWFGALSPQEGFDERFAGSDAGGPPPPTFSAGWLDEDHTMLLRRNTASQVIGCQMVSATDGSAFTGTVSVSVTLDGGTQGAGGGSVVHEGNGYHSYTPTQAETNANLCAFTFTGTGAVPRTIQAHGVSFNPYDAVRIGLTALPNAAAEAAGGLYTRGTGAGQINQQANGQIDTNLERWINVAPLALSSQRVQVLVGAVSAGVIAAASFAAGALDAVWSTTTRLLTAGTNIVLAKGTGITGFNDLSAAQVNAEAHTALADVGLTSTVTGRIDAAVSTRLATAGYTAPLDAAGTRAAVGLAAANLDTQLTTIDDLIDTEVGAIKAKTDQLTFTSANRVDARAFAVDDKTGYAIGTGGIGASAFAAGAIDAAALNADAVDEILDEQIGDSTVTMRQALKLMAAVLGGKVSGAGSSTITFRNIADTTDVVVATVDGAGNRTAITRTL